MRGLNLMVTHRQGSDEFNKLLQTFNVWINLSHASFDYLLLLLDIWVKAFEEFTQELVNSHNKGETLENWQHFIRDWSSIFDKVFAQSFRSKDALQIQGKFLNAAMTWRLQQQQLVEMFLKMNNQPTRSELDELYRRFWMWIS
jgi:class III poly(R)-hydroxyalkanoic acid synthase PhaE subunit